jgi:hypothetical protein
VFERLLKADVAHLQTALLLRLARGASKVLAANSRRQGLCVGSLEECEHGDREAATVPMISQKSSDALRATGSEVRDRNEYFDCLLINDATRRTSDEPFANLKGHVFGPLRIKASEIMPSAISSLRESPLSNDKDRPYRNPSEIRRVAVS